MEQIKADPEVCAISGLPLPKKQRTTPAPAAGETSAAQVSLQRFAEQLQDPKAACCV